MYNSEIKTKFIQQYTNSVSNARVCEVIFNKFEPFENELGTDLSTMNAETLQPIIDEIIGLRSRSKLARLIILKEYVKWCVNIYHLPGACNDMLTINTDGLEKIKQRTVSSPLHLQKYLDIVFSPESEQTVDNTFRVYYWLAYSGLKESDIIKVQCSDVDFSDMVIRYNHMEFPIYRESIAALKNCINLSQFLYNHPNYTHPVWKDRAKNNLLIRGLKDDISIYSLRSELSRKSNNKKTYTNVRISYYRAWISGMFYRTFERELIGEDPDFFPIAVEQSKDKNYKLDSGRISLKTKQLQLANDYMNDYIRWKLAFRI